MFFAFLDEGRKEKQKSRPRNFDCWDGNESQSRGATRLDVIITPTLTYYHTLNVVNGDSRPGAHTRDKALSGCPRKPIQLYAFRYPHTAGSSLLESRLKPTSSSSSVWPHFSTLNRGCQFRFYRGSEFCDYYTRIPADYDRFSSDYPAEIYLPVEPKPPFPRSVSGSSSAKSNSASRKGRITSCAIRSP